MDLDRALNAILARPEDDLGAATASACYETLLALQEARAPDAEKVATISAFADAKRRLSAEAANLLGLG